MTNQKHTGRGDNIHVEGDAHFNVIRNRPTILADIVNALGKNITDLDDDTLLLEEFDIQSKIQYNNVIRFKQIIDDQKIYIGKLNSIYNELDSQASTKKLAIFNKIKSSYNRVKGRYLQNNDDLDEIEVIRKNADSIIEEVENDLKKLIDKSQNIQEPLEVIEMALEIVLVDAFIRCKILEKPN